MMSNPGGLTAWAPAVVAVLVASFAAYRGQVRLARVQAFMLVVVHVFCAQKYCQDTGIHLLRWES